MHSNFTLVFWTTCMWFTLIVHSRSLESNKPRERHWVKISNRCTRCSLNTLKNNLNLHCIMPLNWPAMSSSTAAISFISNRSLMISASSINWAEKVCVVCSPCTGSPSVVAFLTPSLYRLFLGLKFIISYTVKWFIFADFKLRLIHGVWISWSDNLYVSWLNIHSIRNII